jgi:hypothetical protein
MLFSQVEQNQVSDGDFRSESVVADEPLAVARLVPADRAASLELQ